MTSEEVSAAVERLRGLDSYKMTTYEVVAEFMNKRDSDPNFTLALRNRLVGLLEQADPDIHVELPKDINGEYIRLGDELEYLGYDDVWGEPFEVKELWLGHGGWRAYNSHAYSKLSERCRHHHAPTVEGMLKYVISEVVKYAGRHDHELVDAYIDEVSSMYAEKLRELMQDD